MFVGYFGKLIDNLILSCCKIWWVQINFTILHRVLTSCFFCRVALHNYKNIFDKRIINTRYRGKQNLQL